MNYFEGDKSNLKNGIINFNFKNKTNIAPKLTMTEGNELPKVKNIANIIKNTMFK